MEDSDGTAQMDDIGWYNNQSRRVGCSVIGRDGGQGVE